MAITSPSDGSFADGTIDVTARATADASVGDETMVMTLFTDGNEQASEFCPAPASGECTLSFPVNADALTAGTHTLQVVLGTNTDVVAASSSVQVGAHSPASSVGLLVLDAGPLYARVGGGSVGGSASATGWSRTAGLPMSLQLVVDGTPVGNAQSCPATVVGRNVCTHGLFWGVRAGTHQVLARLTVGPTTVDSTPHTMTVLAPTVTVATPSPGTIVHGTVSVTVVGAVAGPDDKAASIGVSSNVSGPHQSAPCDAASATCTATFQVDTRALRSLTGTFTTSHLTVQSTAVAVTEYQDETLDVYGATVQSGHLTTVGGGLRATFLPLPPGSTVSVRLTPAHGKVTTVVAPLTGFGAFSFHYRPTTNTTITASLAGDTTHSAASATSVLSVTPVPKCRLAPRVQRGTLTPLSCALPYLPKGTRVTLQFSAHKHWYTAVSRTSAAGKATLPFHWSRTQTLWVRVVIAANHDYAAYVGKPFTVKVS